MSRGAALVLTLLTALTAGACAALWSDAAPPNRSAAEFQRLVGGLGFGPAADPSRCAFCFDPRLSPSCPHDLGPVPGGACFCPYHGCSVFSYPPLAPAGRAGAQRFTPLSPLGRGAGGQGRSAEFPLTPGPSPPKRGRGGQGEDHGRLP